MPSSDAFQNLRFLNHFLITWFMMDWCEKVLSEEAEEGEEEQWSGSCYQWGIFPVWYSSKLDPKILVNSALKYTSMVYIGAFMRLLVFHAWWLGCTKLRMLVLIYLVGKSLYHFVRVVCGILGNENVIRLTSEEYIFSWIA